MSKLASVFFVVFGFLSIQISSQVSFSPEILEKHVSVLAADSLEGRGFGTNEEAQAYIIEQFREAGIQPLGDDYIDNFSVKVYNIRVNGKNIAGFIPGQDPTLKNEYILLGAHYDHIGYEVKDGEKIVYNGADDNASGVASIIEIGKKLYQNRQQLKRSVLIVAFDGEESGLHGSRQFVQEETVDISKIKLMFSLDMVGMYEKHGGVDFSGVGSLQQGTEILDKVKNNMQIKSNGKAISMRTDTQPFGGKGIPSVHVFTGTESPYHKPEDDANLLDYQGMADICNLVYRFTLEASATPELNPLESLEEKAEQEGPTIFSSGFRLNMGSSYQDYRDEFFRAKPVIGIETGVYSQLRVARHWRLQPEVLYELKGSDHPAGKLRMHAITIPLNLMLTTGDSEGFRPMGFVMAGGYYSYHFAGTIDGNDIDFDNTYETEDYGISFGLGFQVRKMQMGFYSKYGLADISQTTGDIRSNSSYFSLGLRF